MSRFSSVFLPEPENNYKPHIFREASVLAIISTAILIFVAARMPILNMDIFRAAVLPAVLVDQANERRADFNANPLSVNELLQQAAQRKANDMAQRGYFSHISPDGKTPWDWMREQNYAFVQAGENLAIGFFESSEVTEAWMNSPTHRQNLLNNGFTEIGIATAQGVYQGVETTFVVQMFGRPASVSTAPKSQPQPLAEQSTPEEIPSQVGGAEIGEPKSKTQEIQRFLAENLPQEKEKPIEESSLYIAVGAGEEEAGLQEPKAVGRKYSSRLARLITNPIASVNYLYLMLAAIFFASILLSLFREVELHHPKHVFYGVLTMFALIALSYANRALIFTDVVVV